MKISCGVIILNEQNEIFMGHSTGNKFYDIPKGMLDENEIPINCAIRECEEETSIILSAENLKEIGLLPYNKEKMLHLFIARVDKQSIDLSSLTCNSFFEDFYTKKQKPEVDGFKWVSLNELTAHCAKSMGVLLNKLKENNILIDSKKDTKNKI